jgi:hypothetical protein
MRVLAYGEFRTSSMRSTRSESVTWITFSAGPGPEQGNEGEACARGEVYKDSSRNARLREALCARHGWDTASQCAKGSRWNNLSTYLLHLLAIVNRSPLEQHVGEFANDPDRSEGERVL